MRASSISALSRRDHRARDRQRGDRCAEWRAGEAHQCDGWRRPAGPCLFVSPSTSLASGGSVMRLYGGGFVPGTSIAVGGVQVPPGQVTVIDEHTLEFIAPPAGIDEARRREAPSISPSTFPQRQSVGRATRSGDRASGSRALPGRVERSGASTAISTACPIAGNRSRIAHTLGGWGRGSRR